MQEPIIQVEATCPACFKRGKFTPHMLYDDTLDLYVCEVETCGAQYFPNSWQNEWDQIRAATSAAVIARKMMVTPRQGA